ncbi:SPOSA6832_04565 [Sporobolomyces salmonicolor]|uniref:SPOSA6832_04565-mRNA-1:cds n=1 Tax=Sporidiobolus salmonicolor TaxID=5005 RepID=A0A0D6ESC0_SPOSA|nr:SPOSA6832_04565 [Sporobolomyces salmonicolor]
MIHPLALLAQLPRIRKVFLGLVMVTGTLDMIASIVLLAYQLVLTTGFNHVVPSLVVTSFLSAAIPVWFLFSRPYAIRLPVATANVPHVGSKRDRLARFTRSIAAELIALGGVGAWTLVTVGTLHAESGLTFYSSSDFLFIALSFASLLLSTLYFTLRRSSPIPTLLTSFDDVDWVRYSGRPVNRANTVKLPRRAKKGGNANNDDNASDEFKPKKEDLSRHARDDSEVPVLGRSFGPTASIHSFGTNFGGRSGALDWDVQSDFAGNMSGLRDSLAVSTSEARTDQVFVLMCGEPKEEVQTEDRNDEQEEQDEKASATTTPAAVGAAM